MVNSNQDNVEETGIPSIGSISASYRGYPDAFALHRIELDDSGKPVDYTFLAANEEFEKATGLKRSDIIDRKVTDIIPGIADIPDDLIGRYGRVALGGPSFELEHHSEILDRWYRIQVFSPLAEHFICLYRDITVDRSVRQDQEISRIDYMDLYENAPDMYVSVSPTDGTIVRCNGTLCEKTGYTREEILGRSLIDMYHSDSKDAALDAFETFKSKGEVVDRRLILSRKDGTAMHVELNVSSVRSPDGTIIHSRSSWRDITDIRRMEEDMEEQKRLLDRIVSTVPSLIYVYDMVEQRNTYANDGIQRLLGFTVEEIQDMGAQIFPILMHPDDMPGIIAHQQRLCQARDSDVLQVEYRIKHKDGSYRNFLGWDVVFARDADGNGTQNLGTVLDVTELRRVEDQLLRDTEHLEQSNRDLEQFAYVASHDLQEPLRIISSFTQLFEKRYGDMVDDEGREFIAFITDGVGRMQGFIQDLLSYSRIGTRGKPFQDTDLNEVLGRVRVNLTNSLMESGTVLVNDELPHIMADPGQMVQLFQNLISNAVKFRSEGAVPTISLGVVDSPVSCTVSVRDNGIGIDPEFHDRIFQVFQRLHSREEYPGTGIGLSICKRIMERHGGSITFDSTPGEGSEFSVTFPKEPPHQEGGSP